MQEFLLVEGDGCFTIIFQNSAIYNPEIPEISIGSIVKYLWPERAACNKSIPKK